MTERTLEETEVEKENTIKSGEELIQKKQKYTTTGRI